MVKPSIATEAFEGALLTSTLSMNAEETFAKFVNTILSLQDTTAKSLPQFAKMYMIENPLFIQKKIFIETDLLDDIISSIYDLYAGYILLAVKLDTVIGSGRKVRDVLSTVSTSSYLSYQSAEESLHYYSVDDIVSNFTTLGKIEDKANAALEDKSQSKYLPGDSTRRLISGRILEIQVSVTPSSDSKHDKPTTVSVPLYIKLNPRIIPDTIVDELISANITPSFKQRWLQYRAGEIAFFKDFLLQLDMVRKRAKALRHDKSGVLYDILRHRYKGLLRRLLKLVGLNKQAQNIATSIFVFDRYDLKRAASNAGINFDRYSDRQKFFNRNFAMLVYSVDNQYGMVDIYADSIADKGEYTFNQLKGMGKGAKMDLVEIIKALQQQQLNMRAI